MIKVFWVIRRKDTSFSSTFFAGHRGNTPVWTGKFTSAMFIDSMSRAVLMQDYCDMTPETYVEEYKAVFPAVAKTPAEAMLKLAEAEPDPEFKSVILVGRDLAIEAAAQPKPRRVLPKCRVCQGTGRVNGKVCAFCSAKP